MYTTSHIHNNSNYWNQNETIMQSQNTLWNSCFYSL